MQLDPSRKLIRMFVERIIDEVFPEETAAARLQQIGLFTLIYMLQGEQEPVTAVRLAAMTGLAEAQISLQLRKLIRIGLVERTKILNKQGRGRAYKLTIKHTKQTKRLADAIHRGSARRRR